MNDQPFVLFSGVHLFSMLIIVLITTWLTIAYKDKADNEKSVMAKILAYVLIVHVLSSPIKIFFL